MSLKKSRPLTLLLIVLLIMVLGVAGCGTSNLKTQSNVSSTQNEPTDPKNSSESNSLASGTAAPQTTSVTLYFPTADASALVAVERSINVSNDEIIKAMFNELKNPPAGLEPALPKGTVLLQSSIEGGIATLDLSKEFKSNFSGGGTGEQMILYSIVNTLTTLPKIQSVEFLLNGEKKIAILGELDTSTPLTRDESLIKK